MYHDLEAYYTEPAAYKFSPAEIDDIEEATAEIFDMCLQAVQAVIYKKLWERMAILQKIEPPIEKSWREDHCSFFGRFNLAENGSEIKLLEFNADTPTSLLEAAIVQWHWLQEYNKDAGQFNSIHEKL